MTYRKRIIDDRLKRMVAGSPAVLLEGAKAVGKTETAKQVAKTVIHLDSPQDNELYRSAPSLILSEEKPVLLDEWQTAPELWNYIRHQVDDGLADSSVIFTGSSIKVNANVHSGSGRIIRMRMRPYSIEERQMADRYVRISDLFTGKNVTPLRTNLTILDYIDEIYRSGLPGIHDIEDEEIRSAQIKSYVENLAEHDFVENGFTIRNKIGFKAWLTAYSAASGTPTAFAKILDVAASRTSEAPSEDTQLTYRNALETLYFIEELQPFAGLGKLGKELSKKPKHFLMDPSFVVTLLDVPREKLTDYQAPAHISKFNPTFLGQLIESLVYQSLTVYADANQAELYQYRDSRGTREIDFIMQKQKHLILFEVKSDSTAKSEYVKHLNWFADVAERDGYDVTKVLLYAGNTAVQREYDGVIVIPIGLLGA
jgi:predicted AAA+ superfamily ATPase